MGNDYMILQHIYSGSYTANFIRIDGLLSKILQKTFWSLLFRTHCISTL